MGDSTFVYIGGSYTQQNAGRPCFQAGAARAMMVSCCPAGAGESQRMLPLEIEHIQEFRFFHSTGIPFARVFHRRLGAGAVDVTARTGQDILLRNHLYNTYKRGYIVLLHKY